MSETVAAAAPAPTAAPTPVAEAATAAPAPVADVGAPAEGSAEPSPAPAPSPLEQTLFDAPAAEPEKPAEPETPIDPASYELKLPEGMTREDPMIASFLESAAGRRLDGETVQAVLDSVAPKIVEQMAAPYKAWTELNATWQAEIKADPAYAGDKLNAAVTSITGAIDRFGTPELKDALKTTGAANNPHVFRFLHKLASAYAEATPVTAGNSGHVAPPPGRAALDRMYPSSARQANGAA